MRIIYKPTDLGLGTSKGLRSRTSERALGMMVIGPQGLKYHWIEREKHNDI
jgi:hypothetical protein